MKPWMSGIVKGALLLSVLIMYTIGGYSGAVSASGYEITLKAGPSEMDVETLGAKLKETIDGQRMLEIASRQELTFLHVDLSAGETGERNVKRAIELAAGSPNLLVINVTARSRMGVNYLHTDFWRDDISGRSSPLDPPLSTIDWSDGIFFEKHFYPSLGKALRIVYDLEKPDGERRLDYPVLHGIPSGMGFPTCATTMMWQVWHGDWSNDWQKFIAEDGELAEETEIFSGRLVYRVLRPVQLIDRPGEFASRVDTFFIDTETFKLLRWRIERVAIRPGFKAIYHVDDSSFEYQSLVDLAQ